MTHLLPTLCGTFGWEWAAVWEMDEETGQLQRSVTWQTPATDFRAFDEASRDHRFAPGEGLIGSVWSSREPLWVVDVAADPRNRRLVAAASGRPRGAVFIPLVAADRVLGVIELISQELRLPDPKLLDMLSGLGSQFGQFVQRRREQERLQTELESERVRLEAVLQQLPVGVIIAEAPSGKMVLGNPLSETITGQPAAAASIEEYGRYHGFHLDGSPYEPRDHPLARSLTTGEIVSGEIFELERGEDDTVIVEFSSAPIRDGQDQITAGVVVIQDVTERERAQAENRRLQDELETELRRAAEIQAQLLPQAAPTVAGYAFAGVCLPARHTGGDYFDWGATDGGVQVALGDVMGKGMSAALLTATVRAALRAVSNLPVAEAVAAVNRTLFPDLAASASFATLFHAHVDAASGVLSYVDAGHGMAFIYRRDGGVEPLSQRGLALGLLADTCYQEGHTVLEPGETLVIYSDGLPDARPDLSLDHGGVAAQLNGAVNVEEQLERLVAPATAGGSLPDDLTIIIVHRLNGSSSGEYGNEENDRLLAAVGHDGPGTIPLRSSVAHAPARLKTA
jgi:PAS domain S-box-containing protein